MILDYDLRGHLNDGFIAYRMFLAIKQHFNPHNKYHYTSVRNKQSADYRLVKCSKESYEKRNNVITFTRLSKMFNGNLAKIEDFLIANILKDPKWYPPINDEHTIIYKEWLRRVESLMYIFRADNKHLRERSMAYYEKSTIAEQFEYASVVKKTKGHLRHTFTYPYQLDVETWGKVLNSVELNSVYFNVCVLSKTGTHPLIVRETLGGRISVETLTLFCDLSQCHHAWDSTDPSIHAGVSRVTAYAKLLEYEPEAARSVMRDVWHPI